jgi:hypothetical protein
MERRDDNDDEELITPAAAARTIGLNRSTLSRQIRNGAIRTHDGLLKLSEVIEDRANNIDLTKARRNGGAEPLVDVDGELVSLAEARRIKENYLARLAQLRFERLAASLGDPSVAADEAAKFNTWWRDELAAQPAQVAPAMAAELAVEPDALQAVLQRYVAKHLAELPTPEQTRVEMRRRLVGKA